MKLTIHVALLTMAVALAKGSVAADKPTCGYAPTVTPTLETPTPTTETPAPTTETPVPTTQTPAPTTATPAPTPTLPEKRIEMENSATNKTFLISALPVAEGVCFTFFPCLGGFPTAMKWNAPLWATFNSGRSVIYIFKEDRCGGLSRRYLGVNTPLTFTAPLMPQARSVFFRTDPSVTSAVFDPSFITSHASC